MDKQLGSILDEPVTCSACQATVRAGDAVMDDDERWICDACEAQRPAGFSGWVRGTMTGGEWLRICRGLREPEASVVCAIYAVGCAKALGFEPPDLKLLPDADDS